MDERARAAGARRALDSGSSPATGRARRRAFQLGARGRARAPAALALLVLSRCTVALDLDRYRLEQGAGGRDGAAGGGDSAAGGSASGAAGRLGTSAAGDASLERGAGARDAGSTASGELDGELDDAGDAGDAGAAPQDAGSSSGGCRDDADCVSGLECVEAVCDPSGSCRRVPSDFGVLCGDGRETECTRPDRCDGAGACQPEHLSRGTPLSPPDGDCQVTQCDGEGQRETVPDNDDVPPDPGTGCLQPACLAGSPIAVPRGRGVACEGGRCDGSGRCLPCLEDADCAAPTPFCSAGACVACTDASHCPDPGLQCNVAACIEGRCGSAPAPLPASCDDGFFCTLDDRCNARGFCVGDQRPCDGFAPHCSEELGRCVQCTSDAHCTFSCDDQGACRS